MHKMGRIRRLDAVERLPALARRAFRALQEGVRLGVSGDGLRGGVERDVAVEALRDAPQAEDLAERTRHRERRARRLLAHHAEEEVLVVVRAGLRVVGRLPAVAAEDRGAVRAALPPGAVGEAEELAGVERALLVRHGPLRRRDVLPPLHRAVPLRERGQVLHALVPFEVDGGTAALRGELEDERVLHREDVRVPALDVLDLYLRREAKVEEAVHRVHRVRAPVAEAAIAEVVPAAPLALHVVLRVVVEARRAEPGVPVKPLRHLLALREGGDLSVPLVPAARVVHVRDEARELRDVEDARLDVVLELVVVVARVSLVAHLGDERPCVKKDTKGIRGRNGDEAHSRQLRVMNFFE